MDVLVAGGHGQVALRLLRLLADRGDRARGLIRNPGHAADLEAAGAVPIVADLERDDVTEHVRGADAVVFAAGAGPGSGPERKRTLDYGGAVKCAQAAERCGVARFLVVSSIGAQAPEASGEAMRPYLQAKADADAFVMGTGLDWTIVRPGSLTDDPGTGRVEVSVELGRRGPVPRDDVALVLAEALREPAAVRRVFEVFAGDVPVAQALRALGG
jgi:uncharacterized protein YbjT (DUF2867 family)